MDIQLTDEQEAAVNAAVMAALSGRCLTIGGYAGVGKTTLVKSIIQRLQSPKPPAKPLNVAVAAFTGKATSVLRRKGVLHAQTLHSLMYEVTEDEKKQPVFVRKAVLGEPGAPVHVVLIDEASMISQTLYDDLMFFGLPVIFIGDHGQLQPIGDDPGLMVNPEIRLEKIHRQAAGSPIIKAAHCFREGVPINWESVPPRCGLSRVSRNRIKDLCTKVDVILCGFNATRNRTNNDVRKLLGRQGKLVEGERLICLKNDRQRAVFNGMCFTVKKIVEPVSITNVEGKVYECWSVLVVDDDGRERPLSVYLISADEKANDINAKYWASDGDEYPVNFTVVDYGYCLTVHKSQGSSWSRVMVVDECHPEWDSKRWRYTAATRAERELIWVQ
jgi:exodeoxyribonuclease V